MVVTMENNYMDPYQWSVHLNNLESELEYYEQKLEEAKEEQREALKAKNEAFKTLMVAKHEYSEYIKRITEDTRAREKDAYEVK